MKRKLIIPIIIVLIIGIYLNRVYARFFDRIGEYRLPDHFIELINAETTIRADSPTQITYLVLGDSLSRGVGSSSYKTSFPFLYAESIATSAAISIVNRAQPGAKISNLNTQFKSITSTQPNIITILIGINDVFDRTPVAEFISQYDALLTETDKTNAQTIVMTIPYLASANAAPIPFNLLLDHQIQIYNSKIKEMLIAHPKVKLVDLYTLSEKQFKSDQELYSTDLFHPSDKGYILISEVLANHANLSK